MITVDKAKAMDARAAATSGFCGVLFLDIVSFSRMTETGQAQALCALDRIIAASDAVVEARQYSKVQVHPRGDGKLLIFSGGLFPALHAAAQIASDVLRQKPFDLRMGVHYGPVRASDPRMPNSEVVGDGVNTAQRIMDCGDAGHILLSHSAAKWAAQNEGWSRLVQFSGHCAVKHGLVLSVYTLHGTYKNQGFIGKEVKPSRIRYYQQDTQSWERNADSSRYLRALLAAFCIGILAVFGFSSLRSAPKKVVPPTQQKTNSAHSTVHAKENYYSPSQVKNTSSGRTPIGYPAPFGLVPMPDIIGDTEGSARKKLADCGLKMSVVKVEPNDNATWNPKGVVYRRSPDDESVRPNTLVTVYIVSDIASVSETSSASNGTQTRDEDAMLETPPSPPPAEAEAQSSEGQGNAPPKETSAPPNLSSVAP